MIWLPAARDVATAADIRRYEHVRLTEPQRAFLHEPARIALMRKGNQLGGTTAVHLDVIYRCRGQNPWGIPVVHKPPINVMVVSESWDQMGQSGGFLQKLWNLLPRDEIDPRIQFELGRGITGKPPRIVFVKGPGKGSVISFGTYGQGAARIAGSTIHHVVCDEPPPGELIAELVFRLLRNRGTMRLDFTPVLDMPDQSELRKLVADGKIVEHNPWLSEESCTPAGAPFAWLSQAEIDESVALLPAAIVGMRVRGEWDPISTKNWLSAFEHARHVRADAPPAGATLGVGIDHGAQAGKQAASLFAASDLTELRPYAWFVDEDVSEGRSSPVDDARAIKAMLDRHGHDWRDVDVWVGDRPTTADRTLVIKDNATLRRALMDVYRTDVFPQIEVARKGAGSVEHGLRKWNALLASVDGDGRPHMSISPRCIQTADFCAKWKGDSRDPLKNIGDGARYILNRVVENVHTRGSTTFRYA